MFRSYGGVKYHLMNDLVSKGLSSQYGCKLPQWGYTEHENVKHKYYCILHIYPVTSCSLFLKNYAEHKRRKIEVKNQRSVLLTFSLVMKNSGSHMTLRSVCTHVELSFILIDNILLETRVISVHFFF